MKTNFLILLSILIGLLSFIWPNEHLFQTADVVGNLFLRFLKLVSLPLIFLAIISSITGMKGIAEMRQMGGKILKYTLTTTLIAATVGLSFFLLISPSTSQTAASSSVDPGKYFSFLLNIVPENIVQVFLENNVLGVAFLGFSLGASVLFLAEKEKDLLHTFFRGAFNALLKMTTGFLNLIPLGIWAFVTLFVRDMIHDSANMNNMLSYVLCVVGANLFQGLVVLPLFLKWKGLSPYRQVRSMAPALMTAFFTKSSNAALPITLECAETKLGINQRVAKLTLPLCSIINMNACAAFILITVLFVSTQNGITFSFAELILWIFLATLAAVGNAGVPMGCYFLASAFLVGMGVPLSLMGLILPFYTMLDMLETALNVWSDSCIASVVDQDLKETAMVLS